MGCKGNVCLKPNRELAKPFIRSKKISLAFTKEGFRFLCLKSFRRDYRTEMAWKKIAAAHFLLETSPSIAIVIQVSIAERGKEGEDPSRLRSQDQNN